MQTPYDDPEVYLALMPDDIQEIVRLYAEGYTCKQIGRAMGRSGEAIRQCLRTARRIARAALRE